MTTEHSKFLVNNLVCFQNADGKPALHSKSVVPSAFSFQLDKQPSLKALAYMKVSIYLVTQSEFIHLFDMPVSLL